MNITKEKNIKIIEFLEKHEKGLFLFLTILFCSLYYLSYTIHNMPYTNGWGNAYADLVFSGKFPYRDFYYYLPPLNLIIDCILWGISSGHLFIYVLFRLIERLLIIGLVYNLLCKFAKPRYACIGAILGALMLSATVYDLIGDYNQTTLLLNVILTMIYIKYIEVPKKFAVPLHGKKENEYLLLGGFILGLSFLHKQTIFLAQCIIFFIGLTLYFILNHKKNYVKSVIITLLGMFIPISIISLILLLNDAFIPFLNQVYLNVESKGSIFSIMTTLFISCLKYGCLLMCTLLTIYIYYSKRCLNKPLLNKYDKALKYIIKFLLLILILAIVLFAYIRLPFLKIVFNTGIGGLIVLTLLLLILLDTIIEKCLNTNSIGLYIFIAILMLMLVSLMYFNKYYSYIFYKYTPLFHLLTNFTEILTLGSIILVTYLFYSYYKTKNSENLKWIFALLGGIAFQYNTSMGTVSGLINYGSTFIIAVLVTFLLSHVCNIERFFKYIIFAMCIIIPIICMAQKVICTYNWWGWSDTMIDSSSFYTIDVPGLEGFRVSKNIKYLYEEMYKVIKDNTNDDSVIYGFPHVRIFNVLLQNINMNHFVPVPFYDVCSNDYIKEDIVCLKNNPPDIVIWIDIPNCFEEHEKTFRNGEKLEQRKFQEWLAESVNNEKYTLIGQYDSMFIYKLNDGTEINYTYYKNLDAVNKTLFEIAEQNKE